MIYFDNSATTYPKPFSVNLSLMKGMSLFSFNSGRGGYQESLKAAEKIFEVRKQVAALFGAQAQNVVFTKNCTEALNIAIKGVAGLGDHLIISSLEHNSVSRITEYLSQKSYIDYDIAEFSYDSEKCLSNFTQLMKDNTKAVICTCASNVFGVTFPIRRLGQECQKRGILFIVDAAQAAGMTDIDICRDNIDILCCAGHKGLYGPMGSGVMIIKDSTAAQPLMHGGTGSLSLSQNQPEFLPDKFESGTLNNPGIIGLGEGISFIRQRGILQLYQHEIKLAEYLFEELTKNQYAELYTLSPSENGSMPIISFNYKDYSSEKTAALLAQQHICTRGGYHCAYLAHKSFHTLERGTVRLSLGAFNTMSECDKFLNVLKKV